MKNIVYNRIAAVSEFPQINKRYQIWRKLYRATHDSWPKLFNTKEHQRRDARCNKMARSFVAQVKKDLHIEDWDIRQLKLNGKKSPHILWRDPWVDGNG